MLPFYFEWLKVSALTWHTALPPQNKETIIISSTCYRQKNQFLSDKMDSCNISEEKEPSINYPCCAEPATSAPLSREFVRNAVSSPTLDLFWNFILFYFIVLLISPCIYAIVKKYPNDCNWQIFIDTFFDI